MYNCLIFTNTICIQLSLSLPLWTYIDLNKRYKATVCHLEKHTPQVSAVKHSFTKKIQYYATENNETGNFLKQNTFFEFDLVGFE